ncbi:hypothetical protein [Vogesella sp. LIG4]|uniref:hypothetical protein n=1 Tax=Vogesella sp. LIG4 TaxID=1192162 RepID=UPI00081F80D1|nr:hypothetical protein [Vogesella sp. LIG4]SCK09737.1 hypothetical protein PSELUDRAFT_0677 [Vogesella sp. LIG4]
MTTLHPHYPTALPQAWLDCQRAQRQSWQSWQRAQGLACAHLWLAAASGSSYWSYWQRAAQQHDLALGHDCFDAGMQLCERLLALVRPGRLLRPLWRCGQRCVSTCHRHGNAGLLDYARQALR